MILFNFFTESTAKWHILKELWATGTKEKNQRRKKLQNMNYVAYYSELCSDLKLLYTAITRPKKSLIIYDDHPSTRKFMEQIWVEQNLVTVCGESNEASNTAEYLVKSTTDEWEIQGKRLFKKKIYEQALMCFRFSLNKRMEAVCHAHIIAERAVANLQKAKQLTDEKSAKRFQMGEVITRKRINEVKNLAMSQFSRSAS